jgi:hypothetical protein
VPPQLLPQWSILPLLLLRPLLQLVDVGEEGDDRLMFSDIRLEVGIGRWAFDILLPWPLREDSSLWSFWGCLILAYYFFFSVWLSSFVMICLMHICAPRYPLQCLYRLATMNNCCLDIMSMQPAGPVKCQRRRKKQLEQQAVSGNVPVPHTSCPVPGPKNDISQPVVLGLDRPELRDDLRSQIGSCFGYRILSGCTKVVALRCRLSFLLCMLSMLLFALTMPHSMPDDGSVHLRHRTLSIEPA